MEALVRKHDTQFNVYLLNFQDWVETTATFGVFP